MRFVFNANQLAVGDILLMDTYDDNSSSLNSEVKYKHAAIYVGDGCLIESKDETVGLKHILSYSFKCHNDAQVLRLVTPSYRAVSECVYWATSQVAKGIGVRDIYLNSSKIYSSGYGFVKDFSDLNFVARAYRYAGIDIVTSCHDSAAMYESSVLNAVADALEPLTYEKSVAIKSVKLSANTHLQTSSIMFPMSVLQKSLQHIETESVSISIPSLLCPWLEDDRDFYNHFDSTTDALLYISSQFQMYDKVYLPIFSENVKTLDEIARLYCDSHTVKSIYDYSRALLDDAIHVRMRLQYLYKITQERYPDIFLRFVKCFGFYVKWEYRDLVVDVTRILRELRRLK